MTQGPLDDDLARLERLIPAAVRVGGPGSDGLTGTAGADLLRGLAGADRLAGGGGADTLLGGPGPDLLRGQSGADREVGGGGRDTLLGGAGPDVLNGGAEPDLLDGGPGRDVLRGGPGADTFRVGARAGPPDRVVDFASNDRLDLSPLLGGLGPEDAIRSFVQLRLQGQDTIVAVDPTGARDFDDVAVLVGVDARPDSVTPDPLPAPIPQGAIAVELVDVVQVPGDGAASSFAPLQLLSHAGDGSGRLFVDDLRGQIWIIQDDVLQPEPFLDLAALIGENLHPDSNSGGVRSFAFHPDFAIEGAAGFGKFYTVTVQFPGSSDAAPATPIFRWTESPVATVDVLSEWTVDPQDANAIEPSSRREVLRIEQPRIGHSMEHIGFNPTAEPGEPDYGMLYVALGDGGFSATNPDPWRNGQDLGTPHGSILRIDPLPSAGATYSIPGDNPFHDRPGALPEIWAYGLRNPQRFSWDTAGEHEMLIGDIGQGYIEELNLGAAGANYGWSQREGTSVLSRPGEEQLAELPPFDASFGFTYPVAQYDHDGAVSAIAGGFVYRGDVVPELFGKYVFGDLVDGRIFFIDVGDFRPGAQAEIAQLALLREGAPITLVELVGQDRADLRFGQGADGGLYLLTKQDGMIRTLAPATQPGGAAAPVADLDQLLVPAPEAGII